MFAPLTAETNIRAVDSLPGRALSQPTAFTRQGDPHPYAPEAALDPMIGAPPTPYRTSTFSRISIKPPTRTERLPAAGDQPAEEDGDLLAGDSETTTPSAQSAPVGTLGGDATRMKTSNLSAPAWKDYGEFKWWISWDTDGTSGWIVQRIDNVYSGSLADGTAITNATVGAEPSYYEAWEADSKGVITGSLGGTPNRDRWERPRMPAGSKGNWGMTGTVHWTSKDPQNSGFASGKVANAGTLLSSKTAPASLGSALLTRTAQAMWTSTGAQVVPGCFTT
jgi:hypothetical protein